MVESLKLTVTNREARNRLDLAMLEFAPSNTSRTVVQNLIKTGNIKVNSKCVKPSYKLKIGDVIEAVFPPPEIPQVLPEKIPLDVIYEDDSIVVINKQPGLVTHPTLKKITGTLVNALLWYSNGKYFPYIVHRLDKDTSGVIVVAKNPDVQRILSAQFKARQTHKMYFTLVEGVPPQATGEILAPIGRNPQVRTRMDVLKWGRQAHTVYKVMKDFKTASLLSVTIMTGRTHQIRVHMSYLGNPVLGDKIYGKKSSAFLNCERQMLHSSVLEIYHPITGERMRFVAPLPEDFKKVIIGLHDLEVKNVK
ncbi:RluA family pseudouridine synthase [Athalassotoga sp.]|uniref:RluA family pseudouridine synthase n=1 Tax=Athalassotoga sp. TaxID=2022597 RepID=UPI003CFFCF06